MPHPSKRSLPADFSDYAAAHSRAQMQRRYSCSFNTATRWYAESGITPDRRKPTLADAFDKEKICQLIKDGASSKQIAAMYGCSDNAVRGYVKKHDLGPWSMKQHRVQALRPVPDDFREFASTHSRNDTERHYACGSRTAGRWYSETGVRPPHLNGPQILAPDNFSELLKMHTQAEIGAMLGIGRNAVRDMARRMGLQKNRLPPKDRSKPTPAVKRNPVGTWKPVASEYVRDMSIVGQASDFLKRLGPVSRCDANGTPMKDGKFWRRGSSQPITDEEMQERATALGWSPVY